MPPAVKLAIQQRVWASVPAALTVTVSVGSPARTPFSISRACQRVLKVGHAAQLTSSARIFSSSVGLRRLQIQVQAYCASIGPQALDICRHSQRWDRSDSVVGWLVRRSSRATNSAGCPRDAATLVASREC